MIESLTQGVIGLMMLVGNWLGPAGQPAEIKLDAVTAMTGARVVTCHLDLAINPDIEKLVDAGVPLRLKFVSTSDQGDRTVFYRTLKCNVLDYTYAFTDSSSRGVTTRNHYNLIYLALADLCSWEFAVLPRAKRVKAEVELLTSWAAQLNREVDMTLVWGQRKVEREFDLQHKKKR